MFTDSVSQEFGKSSAGQCHLGVSEAKAVRRQLGLQSTEGLTGAGGSMSRAPEVHGWQAGLAAVQGSQLSRGCLCTLTQGGWLPPGPQWEVQCPLIFFLLK